MSIFKKILGRESNTNNMGRTVKIGAPVVDNQNKNENKIQYNIAPTSGSTTKVVRKLQPGQKMNIEITSIGKKTDNPNINTMIIQCPNESILTRARNMVARYGQKNGTSYISDRLSVDIFVNISLSPDIIDPNKYRGNRYLSVVYELSEDGVCYGIDRFPNAIVVVLGETIDKPKIGINDLFGGMI